MTILELLTQHSNNHSPNIREYEGHYGCQLPQDLISVLSAPAGFYDSPKRVYRLLDRDEILNPVKYLGVDMKSKQLLPIFDVGDNDFICYNIGTSNVAMFNIVDETTFLPRERIELMISELEGEKIVSSLNDYMDTSLPTFGKNDLNEEEQALLSAFSILEKDVRLKSEYKKWIENIQRYIKIYNNYLFQNNSYWTRCGRKQAIDEQETWNALGDFAALLRRSARDKISIGYDPTEAGKQAAAENIGALLNVPD